MTGESLPIVQNQLEKLKQLFPETITEGLIDWEKLQATFGKENFEFRTERYVLNWAGKTDAFKILQQSTTATLKPIKNESINFETTNNVFIDGENLEVLKVLQKAYYGKIKCIIIDPPYNTGSDSFIYPDSFKESKEDYQKRIGEKDEEGYLLKEGFFRKNSKDSGYYHSNWLSMMYPRLFLSKNLLRDDGIIFVHIDDNEVHNLRLIMNEIFGEENFVSCFIWEKRTNRENRKMVSSRHDYILCYLKDSTNKGGILNPLPMTEQALARYKNPDNDKRGAWKSDPATAQAGHGTKSQFYVLKAPNGKQHHLPSGRCWVFTENVMNEAIADQRISFGKSGNNVPRIKTFLEQKERGLTPETILFAKDASTNEDAKNEVKELFGGHALFETPKPVELILQCLRMFTRGDDLILDSFGGSGTTGHAVLKQNSEDGGNRKFILVEMESKIARDITAERVKRVAQGYTNAKGENVAGLGGSFRFCELGEPLFDEHGQIKPSVRFGDLARHVYFTETGEPLPRERVLKSPLIGECRGVGIYLLFNGILGDKSANGGNILTRSVLAQLPKFDGQKVIYCAGCLLGKDRLQAERIIVRQTPYEIKVS